MTNPLQQLWESFFGPPRVTHAIAGVYPEDWWAYEVTLDGKRLEGAVEAYPRKGCALVMVYGADGEPVIEGDEFVRRWVFGNIGLYRKPQEDR